MHDDIFDRAQERILALGLSDYMTKRKLAHYAALRESKPRGLSSLDVANIAEDLMTSFTWVATGERDPFELRSTAQNVLSGPENDEPGNMWLMAKNVFSDVITAYQQVELGPSENFKWIEPRNVEYVREKLRELGSPSQDLSFFEFIEECFGVEIIVLDRPEYFTAIGATIGGAPMIVDRNGADTVYGNAVGAPVIVVKQGLDSMLGNYAVIKELSNILAGNLYWYSDVYDSYDVYEAQDGEDSDAWIREVRWYLDMASKFMKEVTYTNRRFPKRLVDAHRRDVAAKKNLGYFLEWMEK
jgi:hypothetical protein